jgi:hypothetical protein
MSRPLENYAPVLLHDKLYVLTIGWNHHIIKNEIPKRIFVIDVAKETCYTYGLPDYETQPYVQPMVGVIEVTGQLCFFVHFVDPMALHLWVMTHKDKDLAGDKEQYWELQYRFHIKAFFSRRPSSYWLDSEEMMCYMMNKILHMYDTGKRQSISNTDILQWDKELQLPTAPILCQWNIYGGYCPTLLLPLTFVLPPFPEDDENKH